MSSLFKVTLWVVEVSTSSSESLSRGVEVEFEASLFLKNLSGSETGENRG